MLTDFFITNLWASIGVWLLLSISDSILTVAGARMYQEGGKEHFDFSGSYELEPTHKDEIDRFQPDVLNGVFILWQPGYSWRSRFLSPDSSEGSIAIEW